MSFQAPLQRNIATTRIVAIYTLFGLAWIYGSDRVLGWLVHDPVVMVKIAVIKGSLFILCTATLLYLLISRLLQQLVAAQSGQIESLKNFEAIFNATNEAILVHDAQNGRILDVNDRMLEIYGYERDEVPAVDIGQLSAGTHPYTQAEAVERFHKAMTEGPQVYEWLCRRKSGDLFWSEVSLKKVSGPDVDRIIAVVRDISERKQAEDALRKNAEMHRLIVNSAMDGFLLVNPQGMILEVNETYCQMSGYSMQELLNMGIADLEANETPEDAVAHNQKIMELGKDRFLSQHRRKDGTCFDVEVSAMYIHVDGEIFVGFIRDITDRKHTETALLLREQALANSERFLKAIIDSEPECIKMLDSDGKLLMMNQAGLEMIQADSFEQVSGQCVFPLVTPLSRDAFIALTKQVFQGIPGTIEFELIGLKERHVWLETNAVPFRNEQGEIVSLLGITRDITERKRADKDRQILERQLLHAQKMESLGVLAGGIAHDFNNILTSIVGNTDLALMDLTPASPVFDKLKRIEKSAARATDLAKQMLAYSGKGKFVVEAIDINKLVQEMGHILDFSVSKKATLKYNLTQPLPSVEADATQIRQVFMNLVINASEAIGERNGVIAITTGCMDCDKNYLKDVVLDKSIKEGRYVYLEIADTGCGMDKETLAKVFDPFFTTKFTGRGLGMAAVQGIVRGHKGFISVNSQLDKGSTFKVFLPASGKLISGADAQSQRDDWRGEGKVLLVDDEETVRDIGKEMLQKLGFTVITANDGNAAIDIFKAIPDIAFVILDLTMPQLDGEECFRELKQHKADLKVIISSGFSEQEVSQKFAGIGTVGFIQKPYKLSVLKEAIQKI
jgi:two-component system, cell cycle sensor histidine kinase and response regulator CckA